MVSVKGIERLNVEEQKGGQDESAKRERERGREGERYRKQRDLQEQGFES